MSLIPKLIPNQSIISKKTPPNLEFICYDLYGEHT